MGSELSERNQERSDDTLCRRLPHNPFDGPSTQRSWIWEMVSASARRTCIPGNRSKRHLDPLWAGIWNEAIPSPFPLPNMLLGKMATLWGGVVGMDREYIPPRTYVIFFSGIGVSHATADEGI